MRFQDILNEQQSYDLGKEVFELWVNLGAIRKAWLEYNRRHPERQVKYKETQLRRARNWWVHNAQEGIEIIQKHNPNVSLEDLHLKLIEYTTRVIIKPEAFLKWLEVNPWAKKYESSYKGFYRL